MTRDSLKKQGILLLLPLRGAQDLSFNYFHRSGNELYLCKSLHNSPLILFWIRTTFSHISRQLSSEIFCWFSNSRVDSFFSFGWYKICRYHLAWLVNINRSTAWSWPVRAISLHGDREVDSFLPNENYTNASAWHLGSTQNIHNSLFDDKDQKKKKKVLQPLGAEVDCRMPWPNAAMTASLQSCSCSSSLVGSGWKSLTTKTFSHKLGNSCPAPHHRGPQFSGELNWVLCINLLSLYRLPDWKALLQEVVMLEITWISLWAPT